MANGIGHGGRMVLVVGLLLFLVSFFAPLSAEFNKAAEYSYFPTKVRVLAAVFAGIVSGLATVIAFLNSSYTRYKDSKSSENGGGVTTITTSATTKTVSTPEAIIVPVASEAKTVPPVIPKVGEPKKEGDK